MAGASNSLSCCSTCTATPAYPTYIHVLFKVTTYSLHFAFNFSFFNLKYILYTRIICTLFHLLYTIDHELYDECLILDNKVNLIEFNIQQAVIFEVI